MEGQDGRGIVWHSVVRPGSEVEVFYSQRVLKAASQLERACKLTEPCHKVNSEIRP